MMTKKVLIVEDNELNMKLFHDLLDAQGYETLQTREGLQALALARLHQPDLILMDIQLPEISGLEVTKWLKEDDELSHIPVVAVTAFAMKGDEERIRDGGCEADLGLLLPRNGQAFARIDHGEPCSRPANDRGGGIGFRIPPRLRWGAAR